MTYFNSLVVLLVGLKILLVLLLLGPWLWTKYGSGGAWERLIPCRRFQVRSTVL
jgi:hypothetical protein